jgi:chemotaxis protein MotB
MDQAPPKQKKQDEGLPGWVMTFADLNSLLLAFFVLLFSFSEMEPATYKEIGGTMKDAFGVQRDVPIRDPLKGISLIARDFSPSTPDNSATNKVQQETQKTLERNLRMHQSEVERDIIELQKKLKELMVMLQEALKQLSADGEGQGQGKQSDSSEETAESKKIEEDRKKAVKEIASAVVDTQKMILDLKNPDSKTSQAMQSTVETLLKTQEKVETAIEATKSSQSKQSASQSPREAAEANQVLEAQEAAAQAIKDLQSSIAKQQAAQKAKKSDVLEESAKLLEKQLAKEVKDGKVEVLTEQDGDTKRLVIRIQESGSFASGSAIVKRSFQPVIDKISALLGVVKGKITVSGHTDSMPINSARYRSNWELSTARSVSVLHKLERASKLPPGEFTIHGHGETRPIATNETKEGRAKNRRVEIAIERKIIGGEPSFRKVSTEKLAEPVKKEGIWKTYTTAVGEAKKKDSKDVPFLEEEDVLKMLEEDVPPISRTQAMKKPIELLPPISPLEPISPIN